MIKQKYKFNFFAENYPNNAENMFRNYYKKLAAEYRYFIMAEDDINKPYVTLYRSNDSIESIIKELKTTNYMRVTINDGNAVFPSPFTYIYTNIDGELHITTQTKLRGRLCGVQGYKKDGGYKYWTSKDNNISIILDDKLTINYKGLYISCCDSRLKIFKPMPFSDYKYYDYDTTIQNYIKKSLKEITKDNINGFYNDVIDTIKYEFNIDY